MTVIALDVMSGDLGAQECVPAALCALQDDPLLELKLVGQSETLEAMLRAAAPPAALRRRLEVIGASEVILMTDSPREAIRRKKNSSMRIAIDLVQEGHADAAVSAGNTGALTAIAHFVLKCLAEVERAPIMSAVPNATGYTHILDLGANVRATAHQLEQFAIMGAIVARDVHDTPRPRVGLLNIGAEESKGHDLVQEAHALLRAWADSHRHRDFEYVGFVEGGDIFTGEVDVVVTDGFTGNVALKSLEGALKTVVKSLLTAIGAPQYKEHADALMPAFLDLYSQFDPDTTGGAMLLGLNGVCIISHGSSSARAMVNGIKVARDMVQGDIVEKIRAAVAVSGAA